MANKNAHYRDQRLYKRKQPKGWSIGHDDLGNAVLNWAPRESDERKEEVTDHLLRRLECPELTLEDDEKDLVTHDPYNQGVVRDKRVRR